MSIRPRRQRRLALGVLLTAVAVAVAAFPFRDTWWGGWILAIAEAGIVGGLADWFAVTALFRHPLGIPIPHTALIPANWQLMAARVGTMVGDRVLTPEYVTREIAQVDVARLVARAALSIEARDIEAVVGVITRWAADQVPPDSADELITWLRRLLVSQPATPLLAEALEIARRHGWDQRVIDTAARMAADALEHPDVRKGMSDLLSGLVRDYRERIGGYPSVLIGLANLLGLIDHDRLVAAVHAALRRLADSPDDPLRRQLSQAIAALPARLRNEPSLASRVEAVKIELIQSPIMTKLLADMTGALHESLMTDLAAGRSQLVEWLTERLERARDSIASDAELQRALDRWVKAQAVTLVERYQSRVASFIERGVHALGPDGAVRLIEEHAGDDLQYIRVNGTVVGGLAGGAIYAIHLLLRLW